MATNPGIAIEGVASAASNVVRLPTAAPSQVKQQCNRFARAERQRLREETSWPGEFIFPTMRAAMKTAERVKALPLSAELVALRAILATMDTLDHAKVAAHIGNQIVSHGGTINEEMVALDFVRLCRPITFGESIDLNRAFDRLEKGADQ